MGIQGSLLSANCILSYYKYQANVADLVFGSIPIFRKTERPYDYLMMLERDIKNELDIKAMQAIQREMDALKTDVGMLRMLQVQMVKDTSSFCSAETLRVYVQYLPHSLHHLISFYRYHQISLNYPELVYIAHTLYGSYQFLKQFYLVVSPPVKDRVFVTSEGQIRIYPFRLGDFIKQTPNSTSAQQTDNQEPVIFDPTCSIMAPSQAPIPSSTALPYNPIVADDRQYFAAFKKLLLQLTTILQLDGQVGVSERIRVEKATKKGGRFAKEPIQLSNCLQREQNTTQRCRVGSCEKGSLLIESISPFFPQPQSLRSLDSTHSFVSISNYDNNNNPFSGSNARIPRAQSQTRRAQPYQPYNNQIQSNSHITDPQSVVSLSNNESLNGFHKISAGQLVQNGVKSAMTRGGHSKFYPGSVEELINQIKVARTLEKLIRLLGWDGRNI